MQLDGSVTIQAPPEKVWAFLTDPHAVGNCAPGLESLEVVVPDKQFKILASVGFGTVKVKFNTDVEWLELDPPRRASMKAHGTAPGSAADVVAEMNLTETAEGTTEMTWQADVTIAGSIASLASRLMGSVTKKLSAAFFDCMKKQVEG